MPCLCLGCGLRDRALEKVCPWQKWLHCSSLWDGAQHTDKHFATLDVFWLNIELLFRCSAHSHLGQLMLESQLPLTATLGQGQYCQQWLRLQPKNDGYHLPSSGHPLGGFKHIHDSVLTQPPGVWIISPALETRKAGLRSNSESCKSPEGSALDPPCSQNDVLSNIEKERHRGKDPRYEGNLLLNGNRNM